MSKDDGGETQRLGTGVLSRAYHVSPHNITATQTGLARISGTITSAGLRVAAMSSLRQEVVYMQQGRHPVRRCSIRKTSLVNRRRGIRAREAAPAIDQTRSERSSRQMQKSYSTQHRHAMQTHHTAVGPRSLLILHSNMTVTKRIEHTIQALTQPAHAIYQPGSRLTTPTPP